MLGKLVLQGTIQRDHINSTNWDEDRESNDEVPGFEDLDNVIQPEKDVAQPDCALHNHKLDDHQ